jgi:hypothetical protein
VDAASEFNDSVIVREGDSRTRPCVPRGVSRGVKTGCTGVKADRRLRLFWVFFVVFNDPGVIERCSVGVGEKMLAVEKFNPEAMKGGDEAVAPSVAELLKVDCAIVDSPGNNYTEDADEEGAGQGFSLSLDYGIINNQGVVFCFRCDINEERDLLVEDSSRDQTAKPVVSLSKLNNDDESSNKQQREKFKKRRFWTISQVAGRTQFKRHEVSLVITTPVIRISLVITTLVIRISFFPTIEKTLL